MTINLSKNANLKNLLAVKAVYLKLSHKVTKAILKRHYHGEFAIFVVKAMLKL